MKSHANLWPRVASFENLYEAFRQARRGKGTRPDVAAFEFDLEHNLFDLQRELLDGTYRPAGYRHFIVREPTMRKISAAPFRDRVVHHALCRVIEPLFDRAFLPQSFANRIGKGTHRALDRCRVLVGRHRYVLKADISKFFPSVDHEILYGLVARRVRCAPTRRLTRVILDSGAGALAEEYVMACPAGRVLEQQPDQPANGEPQQHHAGQPEQQHRVPLREWVTERGRDAEPPRRPATPGGDPQVRSRLALPPAE